MVKIADEKQGDKKFKLISKISEIADEMTLVQEKEFSNDPHLVVISSLG